MPSPSEVFLRLVESLAAKKTDDLHLLYAEDAFVTHPFAYPESRFEGREALREHFAQVPGMPFEMTVRDVVVHETADPEVIVAEFVYDGRNTATGVRFTVPNIFVMRIRDGLIVEARDYAHHRAFAEALGSRS
ncbi:nuclear transport factor 2 family protein [Actinomadura harenae]|uniref:Nuclear transport factor 2 family protein n=1 Tax=Actinomadura harenae TaxID=2483351 RepID=A0A3M2ME32_9ACTN|nr:nuclear transport factor 2 family protein [Actinomadura harenae]RMI47706.1 nuclear transport factor 2 family protein [Actinomadura harenae]